MLALGNDKQKEQEARELKRDKRQERNLHKILATVVRETRELSKTVPGNQESLCLKMNVLTIKEKNTESKGMAKGVII